MSKAKPASKNGDPALDQEVKRVFAALDKDSSGGIDLKELRHGLKEMSIPVRNEKELRKLFATMDVNGDGKISFEEFKIFVEKHVAELRQVFNSFDKDRDGTIDANELRSSLKEAGLEYDEEEVQRLMTQFKTTRAGRIKFSEWVSALLLVPPTRRIAYGLMTLYFPWNIGRSRLQEISPDYTAAITEKQAAEVVEDLQEEFHKIQEHLFVSGKHSVLIVLQGLDTSGKDGAVKGLLAGLNASGVRVESFKSPTELEKAHDYLWRVHQVCPQKGQVTVFNRSHYEDVLVVKLLKLVSEETIKARYEQINQWEDYLSANGTIIIKVVLHISKDEQRNRLFKRQAEHPWKLSSSDWPTHDQFDNYMDIYNACLNHTSTKRNPWHVVPADIKWFRDLSLLRLVVDTLRPYHEIWKKDIGAKAKELPPFARPFPESWGKAQTNGKTVPPPASNPKQAAKL